MRKWPMRLSGEECSRPWLASSKALRPEHAGHGEEQLRQREGSCGTSTSKTQAMPHPRTEGFTDVSWFFSGLGAFAGALADDSATPALCCQPLLPHPGPVGALTSRFFLCSLISTNPRGVALE